MKTLFSFIKLSSTIILKFITNFWLLLLLFCITAYYFLLQLNAAIKLERTVYKDQLEIIELGHQLANRSNFLTSEARAFAVTRESKHLKNYWHEVNVEKTREYTVSRLKQLSALPSEIKLLTQSKRNSDSLIFTEIRSMKLVLEAYHVPNYLQPSSIQKYELPQFEKNLSANDKLILAETIMFDEQYYLDKEKITGPITTFNSQLQERINLDILEAQQQLNTLKRQLNTNLFILALLICIIIWLRVLYIKSPAKS